MKPAALRSIIDRMTDLPWRQGRVETDRVFVLNPTGLAGPASERVMLRMNANGEYAATAPANCCGVVALANHGSALVALAEAVRVWRDARADIAFAARLRTQADTATESIDVRRYRVRCLFEAARAVDEAYAALEALP